MHASTWTQQQTTEKIHSENNVNSSPIIEIVQNIRRSIFDPPSVQLARRAEKFSNNFKRLLTHNS